LAGTVLVAYLIGLALGHGLYLAVLGLPMGVLVALVIMSRRAERFAYARAAGQPGVTGQVLKNLRRGWYAEEEPVAIDPRSRDMVFRAVGRPGVALVRESASGSTASWVRTYRSSSSMSGTARARCPCAG